MISQKNKTHSSINLEMLLSTLLSKDSVHLTMNPYLHEMVKIERSAPQIHTITVPCMMESLIPLLVKEMAEESLSIPMGAFTKDTGRMARSRAEEE
jgi:S-methylmethionine-dependent homocysteine/selenocysteine methylase